MTAHAETLTPQLPERFAAVELETAAHWVEDRVRHAGSSPARLVATFRALDAILAKSPGVVALRDLPPGSGLELLYLPPTGAATGTLASLSALSRPEANPDECSHRQQHCALQEDGLQPPPQPARSPTDGVAIGLIQPRCQVLDDRIASGRLHHHAISLVKQLGQVLARIALPDVGLPGRDWGQFLGRHRLRDSFTMLGIAVDEHQTKPLIEAVAPVPVFFFSLAGQQLD